MTSSEFIVEILNASTGIVTALAWPVVVLIVFFFCMYRFGFLSGRQSGSRRGYFSGKKVQLMLDQIENQCVVQGRLSNSDRQRIQLIQHHVRNARNALLERNEEKLAASLVAVSGLAASSDRHLKQAVLPDHTTPDVTLSAEAQPSPTEVNR